MEIMQIGPDSVLARNPDVAWRTVGGEAILVDAQRGRVIGVNGTAAAIWEALDGATVLREVVQRAIVARQEVALDQALADTTGVLNRLAAEGFVTAC